MFYLVLYILFASVAYIAYNRIAEKEKDKEKPTKKIYLNEKDIPK